VESRTTGGGRLLVAVEWSVCILEGLELPTSLTEEEQQTMCACLMTHNTLYLFNLEYKEIVMCMEQSMKVLLFCPVATITMLHVPYATFLLSTQLS
jgi:hypothetical protein